MTTGRLIKNIKNFFEKYRGLLVYASLVFLTFSNYALRSEVVALKLQVSELKTSNEGLITDMVYFNRTYEDFPLPVWQKVKRGDKFIMQYVNDAYFKTFLQEKGLERYDYAGKTDFDIYDYSTAIIFYTRDMQLSYDGGSNRFNEKIRDSLGNKKAVDVIKWRVIERKDTLIYGIVVPDKIIKNERR